MNDVTSAPGTITVVGTGTEQGTPDALQLVMEVTVTDPTVQAALSGDNARVAQVVSALRGAGVAAADIATANLSVQQNWGPSGPQGYQADRTLTAVLRDLAKAGAQAGAAVAAGGSSSRVDNLGLDLLDDSQVLSGARAHAFADAAAKAAQYAQLAGDRLGRVVSISEQVQSPGYPYPQGFLSAGATGGASLPVSPGQQQVTVSVTVVYALSSSS
ncbi:MAG: SIMPL domain-containing protein [Mycobacteriales bacterium]